MKAAAANLDFERAAALRDQLRSAAQRASSGSAGLTGGAVSDVLSCSNAGSRQRAARGAGVRRACSRPRSRGDRSAARSTAATSSSSSTRSASAR